MDVRLKPGYVCACLKCLRVVDATLVTVSSYSQCPHCKALWVTVISLSDYAERTDWRNRQPAIDAMMSESQETPKPTRRLKVKRMGVL